MDFCEVIQRVPVWTPCEIRSTRYRAVLRNAAPIVNATVQKPVHSGHGYNSS